MVGQRLAAAASLLSPGSRVADIGTDHGELAAFLRLNGHPVIATELNPGPLKRSEAKLKRLGADTRLGDGLKCVGEDEVDAIVIAGMGGETIADILRESPWARDKVCVLQPMTRPERLMKFLGGNGYAVTAELRVSERGREYYVIRTGGADNAV